MKPEDRPRMVDQAAKEIAESLSREQLVNIVADLTPLLREKDKVTGYLKECPGCGTAAWKTVNRARAIFQCRNCGFLRMRPIENVELPEVKVP